MGGGRKFLVLEIKIKQRWDFIYFLGHFGDNNRWVVG